MDDQGYGWETLVEKIYTESGSKVNWGPEVKRTKLLENCGSYLKFLMANKDKLIVSSELYEEANKIANVFLSHKWSRNLFLSEPEQKASKIEILYQFKIKYTIMDIVFKSKIDVVVLDHENKEIHLFDLKTGTDTCRTFARSAVYRYKYMYQAALYRAGMTLFAKNIPEFADYEVQDFKFVYVSRLTPTYPLTLTIPEEMHESFMSVGLYNSNYTLESVYTIIGSVRYYLTQIESGEPLNEPYYLIKNSGEVILEEDVSNIISVY